MRAKFFAVLASCCLMATFATGAQAAAISHSSQLTTQSPVGVYHGPPVYHHGSPDHHGHPVYHHGHPVYRHGHPVYHHHGQDHHGSVHGRSHG
jgi:hypothetical protein